MEVNKETVYSKTGQTFIKLVLLHNQSRNEFHDNKHI